MDTSLYILKLPKDYTLDPKMRTKVLRLAAEHGLSNPGVQQWVDLHVELTESFVAKLTPAMKRYIRCAALTSFFVGVCIGLFI